MGYRWRRRILLVFAVTALTGVLAALYASPEYESVMKVMVKRERVDPLVAPDQTIASPPRDITEEDLNSEVELMKSDDVTRRVVLATGLQKRIKPLPGFSFFGPASPDYEAVIVAKAVGSVKDFV